MGALSNVGRYILVGFMCADYSRMNVGQVLIVGFVIILVVKHVTTGV